MQQQRQRSIKKMEEDVLPYGGSIDELTQLKIQLLKGVDDLQEFELAKNMFTWNQDRNQTDTRILSFLIYEGIFSFYVDLYPGYEMAKPEGLVCSTVKNFAFAPPLFFGMWGVALIPLAVVAGALAGYLLDYRAVHQLDMPAQIRLFSSLEKIQGSGQRDNFIKTVVSCYESGWAPDLTPCCELIVRLRSTNLNANQKWLHLLDYMANVRENNGNPFYHIVSDRNRMQDNLGFGKLRGFTLFAYRENIPDDVYTLISKKFLEVSADDRKCGLS